MGTSQQEMFPVGFGAYNPSTSEMSFSVTDTLHLGIDLYYGIEDAIVYNIDMAKKTAVLKTDDKRLKYYYNDGNAFTLNKEKFKIRPSEALVGSHWRGEWRAFSIVCVFKSWNEVMIIEDDDVEVSHAYVCFDDMVSIKAIDTIEYENLIGKYQGDEMTLCRRGFIDTYWDECVTLRRLTAKSDTAAFQACQTVDDYREYISIYGLDGLFYTAAKNYIYEYVSDSTAAKGHEWVDLGLPSGTLWATCNVGASKPEDYGSYFAWGETYTKSTYDFDSYKYANGAHDKLTKYCSRSDYGNNNFTDNLIELQAIDDAATANWGGGWHTPSEAQWKELKDNTIQQWTIIGGKEGMLYTSKKNGQGVFMPAAGWRSDSELIDAASQGSYWSRSLYPGAPDITMNFDFSLYGCGMGMISHRCNGLTVRPVL